MNSHEVDLSGKVLLRFISFCKSINIFPKIEVKDVNDVNIFYDGCENKKDDIQKLIDYTTEFKVGIVTVLNQQISYDTQLLLLKNALLMAKPCLNDWKDAIDYNFSMNSNNEFYMGNDCRDNNKEYDFFLDIFKLLRNQEKDVDFEVDLHDYLEISSEDLSAIDKLFYKLMCINTLGGKDLINKMTFSLKNDVVNFFNNLKRDLISLEISNLAHFKTFFNDSLWRDSDLQKTIAYAVENAESSYVKKIVSTNFPYMFKEPFDIVFVENLKKEKADVEVRRMSVEFKVVDLEQQLVPQKFIDFLILCYQLNTTPYDKDNFLKSFVNNIVPCDTVEANSIYFKKNDQALEVDLLDRLNLDALNILKNAAYKNSKETTSIGFSFRVELDKNIISVDSFNHIIGEKLKNVLNVIDKSSLSVKELFEGNNLSVAMLEDAMMKDSPELGGKSIKRNKF